MNQVTLPPVYRGHEIFEQRAASLPWHIADVALQDYWEHTGGGERIRVGVIDTGCDINHPDIIGRVLFTTNLSRNWRGKRGSETDCYDGNGHGTHVATTIAAMAPCCEFAIAKALADNGAGFNEDIAEAIDWCVDQGCHVINLSLGGSYDDPLTREAIGRAKAAGLLVFCATGNEASAVGYPARHAVGVGAIDRSRKLAWFSNTGKHVDLVGYGVDILAGVPGGGWQLMSGTSMATPWVTAIAVNRLNAEKKHLGEIYTNSDERMLELETFVTDLGPMGRDTSYGRGMPDLQKCFYERLDGGPDDSTDVDPIPNETIVGTLHGEQSGVAYKTTVQPVVDG